MHFNQFWLLSFLVPKLSCFRPIWEQLQGPLCPFSITSTLYFLTWQDVPAPHLNLLPLIWNQWFFSQGDGPPFYLLHPGPEPTSQKS